MTERRILSGMMLTLLLIGVLTPAFKIQPVKAGGTIYIKADGGIEPPTANITTVDNITYTFTDNNYDEIVVERNNIVVDGAGYTIQGPGSGTGITLSGRSNVTIKNTIIKNWTQGIWAYVSSGITISNNKIINNGNFGIWTGYSNGNTISNNTVASNGWWGIVITLNSSGNTISNNTVTDNNNGIVTVLHSNNNTVSGNEVTLNWGIGISASNYSCYNTISGNTVTSNGGAGIVLPHYSSGNTVSNNTVTSSGTGIALSYYSSDNTVSNNTVASSDEWGILLYDHSGGNNITGNTVNSNGYAGIVTVLECHDNIIIDNRVWNNSFHGIHLRISSGNTLRDNNVTGNKYDFGVWSDLNRVSDYVQDIDTSNTVDGKPIYYWVNQRDKEVPADAGYVTTVNCVNITVEDLNLTKNSVGVRFVNTTDSTIRNVTALNNTVGISLILSSGNTIIGSTIISLGYYHPWQDPYFGPPGWLPGYGIGLWNSSGNNMSGNTITNNDYGIGLGNSSGNTVSGNMITNNDLGVGLEDSSNNTIYHNSLVNNTVQANVTSGWVNTWDDGYPSGGNYWSDYSGTDSYSGPYQNETGGDGIGDTPYTIDANNTDNYPLMCPTPHIKIGVVGPKGWIQWDGLWEGAQMARDEINNAGGINIGGTSYNIRLVDIDEHAVPVPNVTAAVTELLTKLDAHPDMQFLIGGFRTECVFPMREAAMDYAALHGRPIWIIVGAATDELIDDGPVKDNPYDDVRENYERYKYMFRASPANITTIWNTWVSFLRDYVLPQKLAPIYGSPVKTYIVAENLTWCNGAVAGFQSGALGPQAEIVGVARPSPTETDFSSIFDLIEGADARLVIHIFSGTAGAGASFIQQWGIRQVPAVPVGINIESMMQEFYASVGGKCEYESFLAYVGTGTPIIPGVTDKFWNDYEALWGHSPIYTAWGAYDAIMALNETLYGMPTLPNCTTLIPIIEQTDRTGLTGKFKYTQYHDVFCNELGPTWTQGYVRPLLVQWQDGEMEVVWPRDKPYSRKYKIPPWMYVLAETDFVTDGLVDIAELSVITGLWFETPPWYLLEADMNGDNFIDISDLTVLASNWGKNAKEIYGQWPLP